MKLRPTLVLLLALAAPFAAAQQPSLAGTWTLAAADDIKPDGTRVEAYGPEPRGLLIMTADGRYSLQIYRSDRAAFASASKREATPAEFKAASLGMSAHFGRYVVDAAKATLTFQIEQASFPNWNATTQVRPFELAGDELRYRVPATPDGNVPLSVWRRVRP